MTERHDRDSTVVVTDRGGSGMGAIVGAILVIVLLVVVWYLTLGPGAGKSTNNPGGGGSNPLPSIKLPAAS
jgi:hypothetical protein